MVWSCVVVIHQSQAQLMEELDATIGCQKNRFFFLDLETKKCRDGLIGEVLIQFYQDILLYLVKLLSSETQSYLLI